MNANRVLKSVAIVGCVLSLGGMGCGSPSSDVNGESAQLKGGVPAHGGAGRGHSDQAGDGDEEVDENADQGGGGDEDVDENTDEDMDTDEAANPSDAGQGTDQDEDADEGVDEDTETDESAVDGQAGEGSDDDGEADEGAGGKPASAGKKK